MRILWRSDWPRPLLFFILFRLSHGQLRHISPFELTINSGAIRGERVIVKGEDYTVFKGIPYAMPPVGYLRFQESEILWIGTYLRQKKFTEQIVAIDVEYFLCAKSGGFFLVPKEPAKWRGVMNATQFSALCVQRMDSLATDPERHTAHFSEDCLYLNVFSPTPYQYTNDTYPVVVFIHGGDFQSGGGSDYPQQAILDNFVSRKIIFVTFNYRLGPLGFLSTGDKILPGNVGLWDQIWALKWVKLNAEVFGGDPSNILLMGSGSGAACASILALSPRAEGLFHKVLLMSGSALQPGVVRDTAINATWALNEKMQCRSFNSSELLDCFRKRMREEILDYKVLILNEKNVNFSALNSPLAEKLADNLTLGYKQFQNHRLIAEGCKAQYVWTKVDPSLSENILFDSVLKMYSHFWYDAPASRLATYYIKQNAPVFLYSFDHISENFYDCDRAFHGADKLHLFNITPRFLIRRRDRNWQLDQRVVEIFAELIVNFARFGHPTPESSGFAFNWTSTNAQELNYLSITDSPTMEVGYRWQGHVFWNWYARSLDAVDVGNLQRIAQLDRDVGNWQFATAMLAFCSLFFFAILVGLACYCTRKESDDDEL
ncbi:unnamed protein product [Nippostrongylus brasiliensis]|uniref:COesterase domain-containing protein n=1 Tax=Nippostrongylus brasiliensis TaxID=27835 RepID=A0A158QY77_NIPBR|nr:unnamed protein product [Nippostrongylus brasiliensis]